MIKIPGGKIDYIEFSTSSALDIKKLSKVEVTEPKTFNEDRTFVKNGLWTRECVLF